MVHLFVQGLHASSRFDNSGQLIQIGWWTKTVKNGVSFAHLLVGRWPMADHYVVYFTKQPLYNSKITSKLADPKVSII